MYSVYLSFASLIVVSCCHLYAQIDIEKKYRADGAYLSLEREAASDESSALIDSILIQTDHVGAGHERSTKKRRQALTAIVADLLCARENNSPYCYRSRMSASFTGEIIGREPFNWALNKLEKGEFIDVRQGVNGVPLPGTPAQAARFFIQDKLIELAAFHGLVIGEMSSHFRRSDRAATKGLVIVRAASTKKYGNFGEKTKGRRMSIAADNPEVKKSAFLLTKINERLARAIINPPGSFVCLKRVFNNGDIEGFDYRSGGRLVDPSGKYQNMPKEDRGVLTIDGEPVVEVDIQASHFTTLRCLLGSGLIGHSQKMTVAARATAEKKTVG
uniref:hypothetical protein n=1 Tax=Sphingomonas beigongshangi TaxID=2782540 RepID=UPI00193B3DC6